MIAWLGRTYPYTLGQEVESHRVYQLSYSSNDLLSLKLILLSTAVLTIYECSK